MNDENSTLEKNDQFLINRLNKHYTMFENPRHLIDKKMIRNPYAKKRQRPSGWTSASSSNVSTSAPLELRLAHSGAKDGGQKSFALGKRNLGVRREEHRDYKENATNQRSDSYNQTSEDMTSGNQNVKVTATMVPATTSHPSQKSERNPHSKNCVKDITQNEASVPAKRTLASTTDHPSRKVFYNPYARKNNSEARISVPTSKSSTSHQNSFNYTKRKVQSTTHARQSVEMMNGSSAHEKQANDVSIPSNSSPPLVENCRPRSNFSLVNRTTTSKILSCKAPAKSPSSMALIRPASWKPTSDGPDKCFRPSVDLYTSTSKGAHQNLGTQSLNSKAVNSSQHHFGKTDSVDQLPPELSYAPDEVKPIQDKFRMPLIRNAALSSPLKNGWVLFPHQKKAIIRALTMRRMILALDMGLGKTLIGSVWSKAFKDTFGENKLKVFVVCPVSLKEEWQRTAERIVGLDVDGEGKSKAKGKKSSRKRKTSQGRSRPELLRETIAETPKINMKTTICSWAKVPKVVESGVDHFVVCCDEAHAMQSTQAQRTKDVLSLVSDKR